MNHQLISTGAGWRCLRCKAAWDLGDSEPETCAAGDEYGFMTDLAGEPIVQQQFDPRPARVPLKIDTDLTATAYSLEWRTIPGWPDYEVSNRGEVRSWKPLRNCAPRPTEPRLLSQKHDKDGYVRYSLYDYERGYWHTSAHVLVCLAFHGQKPSTNHVVRHLDGNRQNNYWKNVCWGTPAENSADSKHHETWVHGERVNTCKLTEAQVKEILSRPDETHAALAEEYGVTTGAIWHIRDRRTWKHLQTSPKPDAMNRMIGGTHYKGLVIQPTEFCMRNGLDFCVGSILKYITRHRTKNGVEDLLKAKHFVEIREAFPFDIHPPRHIVITMLEYVTRNNIRPDDAEALYRLEAYYGASEPVHQRAGAQRLIAEIDRLIASTY